MKFLSAVLPRLIVLLTFCATHTFVQASNAMPDAPPRTVEQIIPLVNQYCGACHKVPSPNVLPKKSWPTVIESMAELSKKRFDGEFIPQDHLRDITAFYYGSSTATLPSLPYIDQASGTLEFTPYTLQKKSQLPLILNINAVDLGQGKGIEFLICDGESQQLIRLSKTGDEWQETALASFDIPIHTEVVDFDRDGLLDIIVVDLGAFPPTDILAGKIYLLRQEQSGRFVKELLIDGLGRATDARAIDLDQDGDLDLAIAVFGGDDVGEIFWLENSGEGKYKKHNLLGLSGALNIIPADINGDGKIDLISLIAQEHEMIVAFVNEGKGKFSPVTLARAPHPMFGSTSMIAVDMDGDKDIDIVFTNGDAFDTQTDPKPYHGIQWLENHGDLNFEFHNIGRFYGAATAVVGDLDLDGDLDIVAASWVNHWDDDKRQTLVWYENNGKQQFTPRPIANKPAGIVTLALQDLTGDGRLDILAGSFRMDLLAAKLARESDAKSTKKDSKADTTFKPRIILLENKNLKQ